MKTHLIDGIALTNLFFMDTKTIIKKKLQKSQLKKNYFHLEEKIKQFNNPSFPTISSTGPNER